jgi:hypothetical protein
MELGMHSDSNAHAQFCARFYRCIPLVCMYTFVYLVVSLMPLYAPPAPTAAGDPSFELVPGGSDRLVTSESLGEWVELVVDATVGSGIAAQVAAFQEGFNEVSQSTQHAVWSSFLPVRWSVCSKALGHCKGPTPEPVQIGSRTG